MHPFDDYCQRQNRRQFLGASSRVGIGMAAFYSLMRSGKPLTAMDDQQKSLAISNGPGYGPGNPGPVHFPPTAKRVIYLCQSGAPSQIDTFDYKPTLNQLNGQNLPDSIRNGQRLTGMTAGQTKFPAAQSIAPFRQHGKSGQWISDLLPHIIRSPTISA